MSDVQFDEERAGQRQRVNPQFAANGMRKEPSMLNFSHLLVRIKLAKNDEQGKKIIFTLTLVIIIISILVTINALSAEKPVPLNELSDEIRQQLPPDALKALETQRSQGLIE